VRKGWMPPPVPPVGRYSRYGPEHKEAVKRIRATRGRLGAKPCAVDGCKKLSVSRGWCRAHYLRWRRLGDPLAAGVIGAPRQPVEPRFLARLGEPNERGCREWQGARQPTGYGEITVNGKSATTHRLAWELAHGPIPTGMCVCHHCDNPPCCEPSHLFLGTHKDNMQDAAKKGRWPHQKKAA
jgi:hypothetical protein